MQTRLRNLLTFLIKKILTTCCDLVLWIAQLPLYHLDFLACCYDFLSREESRKTYQKRENELIKFHGYPMTMVMILCHELLNGAQLIQLTTRHELVQITVVLDRVSMSIQQGCVPVTDGLVTFSSEIW